MNPFIELWDEGPDDEPSEVVGHDAQLVDEAESRLSDATRARITLDALELIDRMQAEEEAGGDPSDISTRVMQTASPEIIERLVILRGGMMIGEVPRPESEHWREFVENQRDHVARLEAGQAQAGQGHHD